MRCSMRHSKLRMPDAKVTQACCSIKADCRLALTGTPIENRLLDLWTLFRFLMPGLLGSRRRFEDAIESPNVEFREAFQKRLRQQLTPFILRRQKDKVGKDLPPKTGDGFDLSDHRAAASNLREFAQSWARRTRR